MTIGRSVAVSVTGVTGQMVDIEADVSNGLPGLVLIGLPDAALAESKDRVRSAISNSGFELPKHRTTINLSPASVPKQGSAFDTAIAVAVLVGTGVIPADSVSGWVHIGELALDGRLRPVAGILPALRALAAAGYERVVVPAGNSDEAHLVPGLDIRAVPSLREVAIVHGAQIPSVPVEPIGPPHAVEPEEFDGDLVDVVGQPEVVDALIVAAAGGHHLMLLGPPGAGKTMLAARLPGILPPLTVDESLAVSSIQSVSRAGAVTRLARRAPFEAPHHTATGVSLIGGGSGQIRPGAISRAHCGVLFLDEAPEFSATTLDALRQPLESGTVVVHRANSVVQFPARFHLVLAANPCPCGLAGGDEGQCTCTAQVKRRYLGKISGPLLDRIDIRVSVRRVSAAHLRAAVPTTTSEQARAAVESARERSRRRWGDINARISGRTLRDTRFALEPAVMAPLDRALERGALTMRGVDRTVRIAWTLADLDGSDRPQTQHIHRALFLRQGI